MTESVRNNKRRIKRASRIRKKILSVSSRPRLTVFRSNKYIYAQIIDDSKAATIVSVVSRDAESTTQLKKMEASISAGKLIAKKAAEKKIKEVVFDKGGYKFHGRVKAFADAAREGGLSF